MPFKLQIHEPHTIPAEYTQNRINGQANLKGASAPRGEKKGRALRGCWPADREQGEEASTAR
ncbi:MAG: hypothetical protein DMD53_01005 [Gemmatimonadetes bacterium]|nr:MAG: hypothetical protein DMD53_01005 [Gemmatimonadota bacterium]